MNPVNRTTEVRNKHNSKMTVYTKGHLRNRQTDVDQQELDSNCLSAIADSRQ